MATVRRALSSQLGADELAALRLLLDDAFEGDFGDTDWTNSLGGTHVLVVEAGIVLSHASVVPRRLLLGDREVRTGYVEAVATRRGCHGRGHATEALDEVGRIVAEEYEVGALSTGRPSLYARLGWELWRGPTFALTPEGGSLRTADEDGGIMVLRTPAAGAFDLDARLTCDWRPGDLW